MAIFPIAAGSAVAAVVVVISTGTGAIVTIGGGAGAALGAVAETTAAAFSGFLVGADGAFTTALDAAGLGAAASGFLAGAFADDFTGTPLDGLTSFAAFPDLAVDSACKGFLDLTPEAAALGGDLENAAFAAAADFLTSFLAADATDFAFGATVLDAFLDDMPILSISDSVFYHPRPCHRRFRGHRRLPRRLPGNTAAGIKPRNAILWHKKQAQPS